MPNAFLILASRHRRAQIAGLELRELNALEREFLLLLDFRLTVRREEYDASAAALAGMRIPAAAPSGPKIPVHADAVPRIAPARPELRGTTAAAAHDRARDTVCSGEPLCACGALRGGSVGGCLCKARIEPGRAAPPGPVQD